MAKRAGVSRDTISNAEKGQHSLQATTLSKIARALGRAPSELLAEEEKLAPQARSRSSLEPPLFYGIEGERHKSKLPEAAELLLQFGELLLLGWETELPDRAQANDVEWLENIALLWRTFGLINYGVLDELGADGLRDKQGWLARYMDINAAVHRLNAAIRDNSVSGDSHSTEPAIELELIKVA